MNKRVERKIDNRLARRVVEVPKRSVLPFFAVAAIAAVAIWSIQQPSLPDAGSPQRQTEKAKTRIDTAAPRSAKGDVRTLFSADDYPAEAQRNGEEGTVQAELAINTAGRVSGCTILRSSGFKTLDHATCSILQRRARFVPARDVNGNAVPDTVVTPPVVWRLED
jgi:protein TonB